MSELNLDPEPWTVLNSVELALSLPRGELALDALGRTQPVSISDVMVRLACRQLASKRTFESGPLRRYATQAAIVADALGGLTNLFTAGGRRPSPIR